MSTGSNETASVINAYETRKAAQKSYNAQNAANAAQLAEVQRQYEQNREDLKPWTEAGTKTTATLMDLLGYNGTDAQNAAMEAFKNDPSYQWAVDQGNQAVNRSAAAKGGLFSGNTGIALQNYGQNMANQQYGNYYNRLFNMSNMGRGTATGVAQMGTDKSNTVAGLYGNQGSIASNYYNTNAQAMSNMANVIGQGGQYTFDKALDTGMSLYGAYSKGGA